MTLSHNTQRAPAVKVWQFIPLLATVFTPGAWAGPSTPGGVPDSKAGTAVSAYSTIGVASRRNELTPCLKAYLTSGTVREWEPAAAADPNDADHLVVAWALGQSEQEGEAGPILVNTSNDGGRTWDVPVATGIGGCAGPDLGSARPGIYGVDENVTIGADHTVYVGSLVYETKDGGKSFTRLSIGVAASVDGGRTWSARREAVPNVIPSGIAGPLTLDNVEIGSDPTVPGLVYIATTRYVIKPGTDLAAIHDEAGRRDARRGAPAITVSRDGGKSWTPLTDLCPVSFGERTSAPQILARDGHVAVYYYIESARGAQLQVVSSADAGVTWSAPRTLVRPVRKRDYSETSTYLQIGENRVPTAEDVISVASDNHGKRIYLVFSDARARAHDVLGTYLLQSSDAGRSWTAPIEISAPEKHHTFLANVSATPQGGAAVTFLQVPVTPANGSLPVSLRAVWLGADRRGTIRPTLPQTIDSFGLAGIGGTGDYQALVTARGHFVAIYGRTHCPSEVRDCRDPRGLSVQLSALRLPFGSIR